MPTKTARRDYNELLPRSDKSGTQINPAPWNMEQRGEAMLLCFREEEEKTRGASKNLFEDFWKQVSMLVFDIFYKIIKIDESMMLF